MGARCSFHQHAFNVTKDGQQRPSMMFLLELQNFRLVFVQMLFTKICIFNIDTANTTLVGSMGASTRRVVRRSPV